MFRQITSPIYIATMMAQIDILIENGHNYSEIANESIIEAIDSLNPYLYQKGISHMIDNCSTTARLGARKWGPRFDYLYSQNLLNKKKNDTSNYIENFKNHPIHGVLESCNQYRPKHLA
jgi:ketol-acid reductoisomerase